jgi:acetyl-CoA synthetase (ADP-forming)
VTKRTDNISIDRIIFPKSIALIGATEDYMKFGGRIAHHLMDHGYEGKIFPINPKRDSILGHTCYPSVADLPEAPDLALVAVPAKALLQTIEACGQAGVGACIVITAQLGEFSEEGAKLEAEIVEMARSYNMRLVGPNCMGMIVPAARMALSSTPTLRYSDKMPEGRVAFVSQSGAMMGTAYLQAFDHGVGLSGMVSIGNQADLELCDFLEGFIDHDGTDVICLYVEGLKSPERFRELCLRARHAGKRIIAVKAGRTEAGSAMAKSHTSSMAGSFSAFETLCHESGVLLTDDQDAMILCAGLLSRNPRVKQAGSGMVCASGGGGALLADQFALNNLSLPKFASVTSETLSQDYLPSHQNNPLDLGGHIGGLEFGIFQRAIDAIYSDPDVGLFIYVMTPQPLMPETLDHLIETWKRGEKPVILVLNLSRFGLELREKALNAGIPFVMRTDDLLRAVNLFDADRVADRAIRTSSARPANLAPAQITKTGFLTEPEAKAILSDYSIPVPAAELSRSVEEAVSAAKTMGFPVVLKGVVADVVHKSDLGLVKVGLKDAAEVRTAATQIAASIEKAAPGQAVQIDVQQMIGEGHELIVGLKHEDGYGPQIVIGAGGIHVELLHDIAQKSAPVAPGDVLEMLQSLRIWPLLEGVRGQARSDVDAACEAISRLSWLAADLGPRLVDFEVNPFRVTTDGVYALDGRGTLVGIAE